MFMCVFVGERWSFLGIMNDHDGDESTTGNQICVWRDKKKSFLMDVVSRLAGERFKVFYQQRKEHTRTHLNYTKK
jgi:hypothetical protein